MIAWTYSDTAATQFSSVTDRIKWNELHHILQYCGPFHSLSLDRLFGKLSKFIRLTDSILQQIKCHPKLHFLNIYSWAAICLDSSLYLVDLRIVRLSRPNLDPTVARFWSNDWLRPAHACISHIRRVLVLVILAADASWSGVYCDAVRCRMDLIRNRRRARDTRKIIK